MSSSSRTAALVVVLVVLGAISPARADAPANFSLGGTPCRTIAVPASATLPAGTTTCAGVRPGALVQTPIGQCTLNFLFFGADRSYYIGTAGHCIIASSEIPGSPPPAVERTWKGDGPIARDAGGARIGRFAYAVLHDPRDFALIKVDKGVPVSASMCWFGGPTGINTARTGDTLLHYFGNGIGTGDSLPARSAYAATLRSVDHVYALGVVKPGD